MNTLLQYTIELRSVVYCELAWLFPSSVSYLYEVCLKSLNYRNLLNFNSPNKFIYILCNVIDSSIYSSRANALFFKVSYCMFPFQRNNDEKVR